MAYEVVLSRAAMRDLDEIRQFVARDNPAAAISFCEALINSAESLGTFPERGGRVRNRPGLRFLVFRRYLILYRIDGAHAKVRVSRFWHGAREAGL